MKRVLPSSIAEKKQKFGLNSDTTVHQFSSRHLKREGNDIEQDASTGITSAQSPIGLSVSSSHGHRPNSNAATKLKNDFIREMRHLSKLRHPCIVQVMGEFRCVSINMLNSS